MLGKNMLDEILTFVQKIHKRIYTFLLIIRGLKIGKKSYVNKNIEINNIKLLEIGNYCYIHNNVRIATFPTDNHKPKVKIGNDTLLMDYVQILCANRVEIGEHCMLAAFVTIIDEDHGTDLSCNVPYKHQNLTNESIKIGDNVWIGQKATILKGVSIGDNSIIGANAVVTKNVPSNSIVIGSPARVVKIWKDGGWKNV